MERGPQLMLALREDPAAAYRRTAFDARVRGSTSGELALLCIEQVADAINRALIGHARADNGGRAEGLTRAHAALTALEMGIDRAAPLAGALAQLYGAAREEILVAVTDFDPQRLSRIRGDFREVAAALRAV